MCLWAAFWFGYNMLMEVFNKVRSMTSSMAAPCDDLSKLSKTELLARLKQMKSDMTELRRMVDKRDNSKFHRRSDIDFNMYRRRHVLLRFSYLGWQYGGLVGSGSSSSSSSSSSSGRDEHQSAATIETELVHALRKLHLINNNNNNNDNVNDNNETDNDQFCRNTNRHFCGRTDKGVSAFSQVVSLYIRSRQLVDRTACGSRNKAGGMAGFLARITSSSSSSSSSSHTDDTSSNDPTAVAAAEAECESEQGERTADESACLQMSDLPVEQEMDYVACLNKILPDEIRVLDWADVPADFSARYNCSGRAYRYYFPRDRLNIKLMQEAAAKLEGTHDFRNLCKLAVRSGRLNYVRHISSAVVHPVSTTDTDTDTDSIADSSRYEMYYLEIRSSGFLHHQIRYIMGVLFLVGSQQEHPDVVDRLLNIHLTPRKPVFDMAAGDPLVLYSACYDGNNRQSHGDVVSERDDDGGVLVRWYCPDNTRRKLVHHMSTTCAKMLCQASVARCMLDSLCERWNLPSDLTAGLTQGTKKRHYTPISSRQTCRSLEDAVELNLKRGRLSQQSADYFRQLQNDTVSSAEREDKSRESVSGR